MAVVDMWEDGGSIEHLHLIILRSLELQLLLFGCGRALYYRDELIGLRITSRCFKHE